MSMKEELRHQAYEQLEADADRIVQLIKVQMDNLTMPQCPVYEEVLDTQMFGLSKEVNFAVRLGLVDAEDGRELLESLEKEVSKVHDLYMQEEKLESKEI
nr:YlaN family protein [Salinicoccus qingdaonensis]